MRRHFIYLAILAVYLIVLGLPSVLPVQSDVQKLDNMAANDIRASSATVAGIFGNNMLIALFALVPFVGSGLLALFIWQTGLVAASYPTVGLLVYLNPFVWVELPVYALMVYYSCLLGLKLKNKDYVGVKQLAKRGVAYSTLILLISAFIEIILLKVVSV
jgi:hypothetical protein